MNPRDGLDWAENFILTGIRSPDLPTRSPLPYRLRYPALGEFVTAINLRVKNKPVTGQKAKTGGYPQVERPDSGN